MRARVGWCGMLLVAMLGCSGVDNGATEDADSDGDDLAEVEGTAVEGTADEDAVEEDAADEVVDDDAAAEDEDASAADGPGVALPDGDPIPVGAVPRGVYRTGAFTVPASFEVSEDGWIAEREGPFDVLLWGEEPADESRQAVPKEPRLVLLGTQLPTTVEQLVADLEALAGDVFTVTDKGPTSLGGLDGTVLETVLTGSMAFAPLRTSAGEWVSSAEDRLVSIHVLETGGNPVLVLIEAERADSPDHLERVQPILDTLLFAP